MKTNINYTKPKILITSAVLLLAACLSSCSKKDDTVAPATPAYIMATNAAEPSDQQDFYVDDSKINTTTLAYTESTAYIGVKAGSHQLAFKSSSDATLNSSASLNTDAGKYYSVFYTDDKSTVTVTDDHTAPQTGKARIRFINLSSALNAAVDLSITGGDKLITNLAYKTASAYYDIDAASKFSLYLAGGTDVSLNIPVTLQAGTIYTIYISGATEATTSYHVLVEN